MAPSESKTFILKQKAIKDVNFKLDQEDSTFKLVQQPLKQLKDGHILVRTLYLSNDPTQRSWIQKGLNPERMYTRPVQEGEPMASLGMGEVIESNSTRYKKGDLIVGRLYWSDYCDISEKMVDNKVPDTSIGLPVYLSSLGMTGLTAYFGLLEVAQAKKGDTVVVSAASGATGLMAVQIAKALGCHVIGISGGEDKCKYVEGLGADVCVNYKDPNFKKDIRKALGAKKYCDIFFDNVGGEILDVMLTLTRVGGTIVACGAIAGYNDATKLQVKNWPEIIANRLIVKGFIIIDFHKKYSAAVKQIAQWIKNGQIRTDDTSFSMVDLTDASKFKDIPNVWGTLFTDKKPGKLLTKIAEPKL